MKKSELESDPRIFDLTKWEAFTEDQKDIWRPVISIPAAQIAAACEAYANGKTLDTPAADAPIYEHREFPGLQVVCGLLPPETQILFTSCLMHRDLADPGHKINLQIEQRHDSEHLVVLISREHWPTTNISSADGEWSDGTPHVAQARFRYNGRIAQRRS